MNESWLKSKLIKFMFAYWAGIILLTYSAEWLGRHGPALHAVLDAFCVGIVLYIALRIVAWRRRDRMW